jgi:hypothetical protein
MFTTSIEAHPTDPAALVLVVTVAGRRFTHEVRDAVFIAAVTAAGKVKPASEPAK